MATVVIFGNTADAALQSTDATYSNAREGLGAVAVTGAAVNFRALGQTLTATPLYVVLQLALLFDTSILTIAAIIDEVTFYFCAVTTAPLPADILELRASTVTSPVVAADFIAGSLLASKTFLASAGTNSSVQDTYLKFNSDPAFLSALNLSGLSGFNLSPANQRLNVTPNLSDNTYSYYMSDDVGTDRDPKLLVVYHTAVAALGGGPLSSFRRMLSTPRLVSP